MSHITLMYLKHSHHLSLISYVYAWPSSSHSHINLLGSCIMLATSAADVIINSTNGADASVPVVVYSM